MTQNTPPAVDTIVVETTGDFMLQDVSGGQDVQPHRPSLVRKTPFIVNRLDSKQLAVVDANPSEKTDEEVEAKWRKGDYKKAKAVVVPPKAGTELGKDPIKPGSKQNKDESDEAYLIRLDAEKKAGIKSE